MPRPARSAPRSTTRSSAAANWPTRLANGSLPGVQVVFGGGPSPLWRQLVDAWPRGEPVLSWRVCSPFWPGADSQTTPFESIAEALRQREASLEQTELELICPADVAGDRARPVFPFALLRGLRDAAVPGDAGPARARPPGDARRRGAGPQGRRSPGTPRQVGRTPRPQRRPSPCSGPRTSPTPGSVSSTGANIEAGVLLTCPVGMLRESDWRPPLVEAGAVDWATCASHSLMPPPAEPDDPIDWPAHLRRVDLDIHWGGGPDPAGTLSLSFVDDSFLPTAILDPGDGADAASRELVADRHVPEPTAGRSPFPSTRRRFAACWYVARCGSGGASRPRLAAYPINVLDAAKAGLPSVLGARPDEQQLLAYFHGRIGEDDLLMLLEQRAQQLADGVGSRGRRSPAGGPPELPDPRVRREPVRAGGHAQAALYSPRALETALLGEFSPAALAERVLTALRAGRRSATAAAFQFTELVRVVAGLPLGTSEADQTALAEVLTAGRRSADWGWSHRPPSCRHSPARSATRTSRPTFGRRLPREFATRFLAAAGEPQPSIEEPREEPTHDPAS